MNQHHGSQAGALPLAGIQDAHQEVDRRVEIAIENARWNGKPVQISCRRGCSACCSEPVYAERAEAELIVEKIRGMPPSEQERIGGLVQEWVHRVRASGLLDRNEPHVLDYRRLRLACPLLLNGECLVYRDRPLGCRSHMALLDRRLCEDDSRRMDQRFAFIPGLMHDIFAQIVENQPRTLVMDHFGLLLHEVLHQEKVKSESRKVVLVQVESNQEIME